MDSHFYEVNIDWNQDRKGVMCSPEINPGNSSTGCVEVATPPQFDKGIAGIWSPEHLFTAAVSSCLMTTFLAIAENFKLEFTAFQCKSKGRLEKVDGKFVMSEVILEPTVTILREEDQEKAIKVITKAEAACLISNSITSKITLEPTVKIAEPVA